MLMADMYNHGLTETTICGNCANSVEDVYHHFFNVPGMNHVELLFFQAIKIL